MSRIIIDKPLAYQYIQVRRVQKLSVSDQCNRSCNLSYDSKRKSVVAKRYIGILTCPKNVVHDMSIVFF